jgi:peptidoglycan hydrolase-like protein with peptidoglycan-binding domain
MTDLSTDFGPWSVEPELRKGIRNDTDVEQLQQLLRVFVDPSLAIDGDFGDNTETAVIEFQTTRGLPTTGVVDQPTWRELLADVVSPYTDGMVGAKSEFDLGEEAYAGGDYAAAIDHYQRAIDSASDVQQPMTAMSFNIAISLAHLGDAEQCRLWAAHHIRESGIGADKRAYQLYFYAAENDLGSMPFDSLGQ